MLQQSEVDNSFATFERSLQMARRLGHREFETRALNDLAIANRQCGNYAEAMLLVWESLALAREIDDPTRVATALSNLVVLHIDVGKYAEAARIAEESMAANERNDDAWGVAIDRLNYTAAILKSEGPEAALHRYVEWAEHIASFSDNELTIDLAELGATIYAGLGKPELAARLLGSAESQRDGSAMRRSRAEQTLMDEWILPARSAVDPPAGTTPTLPAGSCPRTSPSVWRSMCARREPPDEIPSDRTSSTPATPAACLLGTGWPRTRFTVRPTECCSLTDGRPTSACRACGTTQPKRRDHAARFRADRWP
jgi:hypothetical protein